MAEATKKYAVVTGANKGIGLEVCRQLASHGITIVLTARNENRGVEAIDKLKASGLPPDSVIFHQLDVTDPSSVASFAEFIKSQFGKLDILVNNAGQAGVMIDGDALKAVTADAGPSGGKIKWEDAMTQTKDLATDTVNTNYYGAKRTTEALLPLLQLSDSPRIVNVSSSMGKLKNIPNNKWATGVLSDISNLTEERIDDVLQEFLKDVQEGSPEAKGWPPVGAYAVSKAALNAYTRILATKYPKFRINCVCPGFVKTDMNMNTGALSVEEGAETPVMAALLPDDGPTGQFIVRKEVSSFEE